MGAAGDFAPGRGVRLPRLIPFPVTSGQQEHCLIPAPRQAANTNVNNKNQMEHQKAHLSQLRGHL